MIVKINNIPNPKADFYTDLIERDIEFVGSDTITRNSRSWYLDDQELNSPQRTELNNTGTLTLNWGQVKDALRFKEDQLLETDTPSQRLLKSRPITDIDVTG